ncbi:transmembrane protein 223 [Megalops cyprinoides]|uniref:transmembrane protein 223 n=1 Tax=Megalops cyprinoides TaxID=118141 RepID=UPI00186407D9|nr:transmembrane protein 223 [Megalops cyprinoides]
MWVQYLLSGGNGCPCFVTRRCMQFLFRHRVSNADFFHSKTFSIGVLNSSTRLQANTLKRRLHTTSLHWNATPIRFHVTSTAVAKDVILFEHDRTRFFRLLSLFCAGQLLFWTYLAHFAFTSLRDTRSAKSREDTAIAGGLFGVEANLGSNSWRYGFTVACLAVGGAIVGLGVVFCCRSVSQVILHKGGGAVTVATQSPLGLDKARRLTVPLAQVACYAHRQESPSFIPLRVKGHRLYFLLDKEGTLNNPKLFDITVGAYRPL